MLTFHYGEILKNENTIVLPVSLDGCLDKNLKARIKKEREADYTTILNDYETTLNSGTLTYKTPAIVCDGAYILLATKRVAQYSASIDYVRWGIEELISIAYSTKYGEINPGERSTITDKIAIPKLGCDDGLSWKDVRMLYEISLSRLPLEFQVYGENIDPNEIWAPVTELSPLPESV